MKLRANPIYLPTLILFLCQSATATPIVSFSTLASPTTIGVGQTLTVAVQLSGLGAGQQLDSLAATVVFDGSLLGTPTVTTGPIVPNPLDDPLDLLISTDSGLADVAFLTFGTEAADHITSNGTFFTLKATALAPGSSNVAFDFAGGTLFNPANPNHPMILTVEPSPPVSFVVVPEPCSLTLAYVTTWGISLCCCSGRYMRRRQAN